MPTAVLPDIERIVMVYLKASTRLRDANGGTQPRVSAVVGHPWPMIRLFRTPGATSTLPEWVDEAELQIEVWGDPDPNVTSKRLLGDLARTALAELLDLRGVTDFGVVQSVRLSGGIGWLPDPDGQGRYLFHVIVRAHPIPGA